jgi:hypothetical protein
MNHDLLARGNIAGGHARESGRRKFSAGKTMRFIKNGCAMRVAR